MNKSIFYVFFFILYYINAQIYYSGGKNYNISNYSHAEGTNTLPINRKYIPGLCIVLFQIDIVVIVICLYYYLKIYQNN